MFATPKQLKKLLLKYCLTPDGHLDLSMVDLSDFNGNVYISNWIVKNNLYINNHIVYGDMYINKNKVGGNVYEGNNTKKQIKNTTK